MTGQRNSPLPGEFVLRMRLDLGNAADAFLHALEGEEPPVSIRLHPIKWNKKPDIKEVPWCSTGFYLENRPSFTLDPWFHGGAYYVQEPGSMFLEQAFQSVNSKKQATILDLCGAPGGKSTHLLSLLGPEDILVTNEVIRSRALILQENIQKWGYSNVVVTNSDPREFARLKNVFDIVVVDAPCSGEGMFRKDPNAIEEWSVNNTLLCASRQKRIISDAWECLKPGGYLIYSTCTYNSAENEENLNWLAEIRNASPVSISLKDDWNVELIQYQKIQAYRLLPHKVRAEGFFTGILQKEPSGAEKSLSGNQLKQIQKVDFKTGEKLKIWLTGAMGTDFVQKEDTIYFFSQTRQPLLSMLEKHLHIVQPGLPVCTVKGNILVPHAALALANDYRRGFFPESELSLPDAIRYLQRESIQLPGNLNGWVMATFRGLPLGWLKTLGYRSNNYFPKERRIRMQVNQIPELWHTEA
jgi:16S rRNA C967 or C1407 C5-methylase (RsmB/RsmF family)/NOL1/NOP2/fmu family ribosome biogenesis protein